MPQLIVELPDSPPKTYPLTLSERGVTLGRAEDNDMVLIADEVSRHHARIVLRGGKPLLIDLNSMNGTYVNRQRVVERVLSDLDDIWFGSKCHMVYRDDTAFGYASARDGGGQADSALADDLNRIRDEMDRLGDSMTLIASPARGAVRRSAEAAAGPVGSDDLEKMSRAYRRLAALHQASRLIASDFDLDKRLAAMLDTVIEVLGAERGFVMLRDAADGGLRVMVARQMGQDLEASSPSMGIAGKAAIDGEPVLMADSGRDAQFGGRASIIQQRIASAMCVPLRVEDRTLGSIYLDTRRPGDAFTSEDLELFSSLASQSALAIENVRFHERLVDEEKKRANLARFLSPAIVEEVMKQDTRLELGGAKRVATTMFCDIRGFTPIAERIVPADLVALLNEHFTAMTAIVFEHAGTLDKYIGDEIMAVFGSPLVAEDDALRAVRAAMAMQERNAALNAMRAANGSPVFELGIGINTGDTIAGYVGSPDRMEFTVVGDSVNTARRFCSLAGPGQVVVGEHTYAQVREHVEARATGSVMLKGKGVPVHGYEILRVKS